MARRTVTRRRKTDLIATASRSSVAAGYIRVSTEEQAAGGVSLDAQADRIRAYATVHGLELTEVYRDEGVSAGMPLASRPEGSRLAAAICEGRHAHVIALKLDRCFRNAADCMATLEGWQQRGVSVHLVDLGGQAVDTATAMGRFFVSVMASCAELELNTIRDRTRTALEHKRRRGDRLGTTPIGFRTPAPGLPLAPDERELAVVRRLLELCAQDLPYTRVAEQLTGEGHRTKRGCAWHSATVRLVWLARDRYRGVLGPPVTVVGT